MGGSDWLVQQALARVTKIALDLPSCPCPGSPRALQPGLFPLVDQTLPPPYTTSVLFRCKPNLWPGLDSGPGKQFHEGVFKLRKQTVPNSEKSPWT